MAKKTIEERTAETLLQTPVEVVIDGEKYRMAPPSIATLVMISALVSKLPRTSMDKDNMVTEVLRIAEDCGAIGEIVAVLVLGAKGCSVIERRWEKKPKSGLLGRLGFTDTVETSVVVDRKSALAKKVMECMEPREVFRLCVDALQRMQIADFFALTTSLLEINITKPTKEVGKTTTASGQ